MTFRWRNREGADLRARCVVDRVLDVLGQDPVALHEHGERAPAGGQASVEAEHGVTVRHRRVGRVVGKVVVDAVVEGAPCDVGHLGGASTEQVDVHDVDLVASPGETVGELVDSDRAARRKRRARDNKGDDHADQGVGRRGNTTKR